MKQDFPSYSVDITFMDILQIDPWIDPAPSHERDMRLDQIRQQIKKKKPWAFLRNIYIVYILLIFPYLARCVKN